MNARASGETGKRTLTFLHDGGRHHVDRAERAVCRVRARRHGEHGREHESDDG
jgi:hypothetical protein